MTERSCRNLILCPKLRTDVPSYRTEIVIPADRYVCLQLPDHMPVGRASVTVEILGFGDENSIGPIAPVEEMDRDVDDFEWWDEFE